MKETPLSLQALRTVIPYTLFGCLWIWGSDSFVLWFTHDPDQISQISMIKGWLFIATTSILLFILVMRKLRKQERLHQQLETRRIDLEEFLYAASHHLKTPLVTMHGFSSELRYELDQNELDRMALKETASRFIVASSQMEEILRNITHLHRSLRHNPKPTHFSITTRVESQIELAKLKYPTALGMVRLSPLPTCTFDAEQFDVILRELFSNFFRHCKGQEHSELHIYLASQKRGSVTVAFEDNGPGFSVPPNQSLFHPALRKPSEQDSAGLRIGLAIAWRCATWNGGDLEVTSAKGRGTKVLLTLPT